MRDVLQRLLDAEAARIGEAPGRIGLGVRPGREGALAEAAHAIGLILADHAFLFLGRDEDQRVVRGLERLR
jgi:hypothetical protein